MDVELIVNGMDWKHGNRHIRTAVHALDGVERVDVHLERGQVKISYDPEKIALEAICEVIEGLGYGVDR